MKRMTKLLICAISFSSLMTFASLADADDHAIIIGCDNYRSERLTSLQGAVNDAKEYESRLHHNGFRTVTFVDNPTCHAVNAAIHQKMTELKNGDTLTFIFCGHGRNYQKRSYLCFNDTMFDRNGRLIQSTALSVEDLLAVFDRVNLQNLTLILDACRAGSLFDRHDAVERFNLSGSIELNRNTMIIYSASPGQNSLELGNRGCFSKYFAEALTGYGDVCNGNIDGFVTYREAFDYAVKRLQENNISQVPFAEGVWGDVKASPVLRSTLDDSTKRLELEKRKLVMQGEHQKVQQERQIAQQGLDQARQGLNQAQLNLERQQREIREIENKRKEIAHRNVELQKEREELARQVSVEAQKQRQRQYQLQVQQQQFRQEAVRQGARIGLKIAMKYIR